MTLDFSTERGFRFFGWLQLCLVALHYLLEIFNLFDPRFQQTIPRWIDHLMSLCTLAGLVVGLAIIKRSARLATHGLTLWALFSVQGMIHEISMGRYSVELVSLDHFALLFVGPLCIISGFWSLRELPGAIGVSLLVFFLKALFNHLIGGPVLMLTPLQALVSQETIKSHLLATYLAGLAAGLVILVTSVLLLRAKHD